MLRACLFLMFFFPLTFAMATVALFSTFFDTTGAAHHRIACAWSSINLWMAGATVEISGQENIPKGSPVIFMSNHQSSFDIPTLYYAIPARFSWIAKEELFSYPVFGQSMRRAGYIPLDRSDGRKSLKSIIAAALKINLGHSVVIFPEGTRSEDGRLIPFKKGGFLLAEKAVVPIVPVTISGSAAIMAPGKFRVRPGTIRVKFAEAISGTTDTGRNSTDLMNQVRKAIDANLEV